MAWEPWHEDDFVGAHYAVVWTDRSLVEIVDDEGRLTYCTYESLDAVGMALNDARVPWARAQEVGSRESWEVRYTIEGAKTAVLESFERTCRNYHPAGYGTRMLNTVTSPQRPGWMSTDVSRARSCD